MTSQIPGDFSFLGKESLRATKERITKGWGIVREVSGKVTKAIRNAVDTGLGLAAGGNTEVANIVANNVLETVNNSKQRLREKLSNITSKIDIEKEKTTVMSSEGLVNLKGSALNNLTSWFKTGIDRIGRKEGKQVDASTDDSEQVASEKTRGFLRRQIGRFLGGMTNRRREVTEIPAPEEKQMPEISDATRRWIEEIKQRDKEASEHLEQVNLHSKKMLEENALRKKFTALLRGNASRLTLYQEADTPEKQKILEEVQNIRGESDRAYAYAREREREELKRELRQAFNQVGTSEEKILETLVIEELASRSAARIRDQEAQNRKRAIDLKQNAVMVTGIAG